MGDIKPIETVYNGYRFRSRLEARWAVFFDAMGIRYEYEHEGFERHFSEFEPPVRYLPDFYLPEYGIHAEVKGAYTWGQIPQDDAERMYWMIDFNGPLSNGLIMLGHMPKPYEGGMPAKCLDWAFWKNDHKSICYGYITSDYPDPSFFQEIHSDEAAGWINPKNDFVLTTAIYPYNERATNLFAPSEEYRTAKALCYAKQARFEHGETPKV